MTNLEVIQLVIGSGGLLGILIGMIFLSFRTGKIIQQVNTLSADVKDLKGDLRELKVDISDIKERVSFMEAFMFFSEFTTESNNPRSEAAKEMWKRRKQKTLENTSKGK